ncbi:MAG: ion channel, partial [Gemmatimonadaceae bacterium]
TALWWTAMIITTLGSDYWPLSPEGRVLCLLLAIYSFAVWGYITASLATFFLDRDAADSRASIAGESSIELLRSDIAMLRAEVQALRQEPTEER